MIVAIDFDGTCVEHKYPEIGGDIGAVPVLKQLTDNKHQLILWTMRSGKELAEAYEWFAKNDIPLYGVNKNPSQSSWTTSPKAYANMYIDDAALGCPLVAPNDERPYVDWDKVSRMLKSQGLI